MIRLKRVRATGLVIVAAFAPASVGAQFSYVSQAREVRASCQTVSQTQSTTEVGPFIESAVAFNVTARQTSALDPWKITFAGDTTGGFCPGATANSKLDVQFSISRATRYRLTMTWTCGAPVIRLSGPVGAEFNLRTDCILPQPRIVRGTLTPGIYTLNLAAPAGTEGGIVRGSVTGATLELDSCRADFDGNEQLQAGDVFAFLNAYFARCTSVGPGSCQYGSADFDDDGQLRPTDIFAFLDAYFAGCTPSPR